MVNAEGRLLAAAAPDRRQPRHCPRYAGKRARGGRTAFLEDFFKILTDPGDRMTATQVLEMVAKQGVLVGPFADRYETEKVGVLVERVGDILMRAGQIAPMPPEMLEAGAYPLIYMKNPLARMARAGEAAAWTRWVEIGVQAAGAGRPEALDRVDFDKGMVGVGEVLGVRPSWILTTTSSPAPPAARGREAGGDGRRGDAGGGRRRARPRPRANQIAAQLGGGGGL
jgi:hypothetical protein